MTQSLLSCTSKRCTQCLSSAQWNNWCRDTQESAPSLSKLRAAAAASLAKGSTFWASQACRRTSRQLQRGRHGGEARNDAHAVAQDCRTPNKASASGGFTARHLPTQATGRVVGHARGAGVEGSDSRSSTEKPPYRGCCQSGWTCQPWEAAGPQIPSSRPLLHREELPDHSGKQLGTSRTLLSWAAARTTVLTRLFELTSSSSSACRDIRPTFTLSFSGAVKRLLS